MPTPENRLQRLSDDAEQQTSDEEVPSLANLIDVEEKKKNSLSPEDEIEAQLKALFQSGAAEELFKSLLLSRELDRIRVHREIRMVAYSFLVLLLTVSVLYIASQPLETMALADENLRWLAVLLTASIDIAALGLLYDAKRIPYSAAQDRKVSRIVEVLLKHAGVNPDIEYRKLQEDCADEENIIRGAERTRPHYDLVMNGNQVALRDR